MKSTSMKQNEAQYMETATLICLVGELEKLLKSFYCSQYFQHVWWLCNASVMHCGVKRGAWKSVDALVGDSLWSGSRRRPHEGPRGRKQGRRSRREEPLLSLLAEG